MVVIDDKKQEHQTNTIVGILADENIVNNHQSSMKSNSTEKIY
jgi:hypothetical protein